MRVLYETKKGLLRRIRDLFDFKGFLVFNKLFLRDFRKNEKKYESPLMRLLKVPPIIKKPGPNPKFSEYIFKRGQYIL